MLWLDLDLSGFHRLCATDPLLRFVHRTGAGRMLRSPTAFEDVVKTVCTTNCGWRNTKRMCEALCALADGAFPTPHTILRLSERSLAHKVPVGYRAKTIRTVAKLVAEGNLPLDQWASTGDYPAIEQALQQVWGIGPYALAHMLVLLGCFERIPVDSEVLRISARPISPVGGCPSRRPFGHTTAIVT